MQSLKSIQNAYSDQLGSISWGTLRLEDTIPAMYKALRVLDKAQSDAIALEYGDILIQLVEDHVTNTTTTDSTIVSQAIESTHELYDALYEALNECALPGLCFGTHPGDGSDLGFWPMEPDDLNDAMLNDKNEIFCGGVRVVHGTNEDDSIVDFSSWCDSEKYWPTLYRIDERGTISLVIYANDGHDWITI